MDDDKIVPNITDNTSDVLLDDSKTSINQSLNLSKKKRKNDPENSEKSKNEGNSEKPQKKAGSNKFRNKTTFEANNKASENTGVDNRIQKSKIKN